jgi:hypothetical protein
VSPCLRAFWAERALPSGVRGPVLSWAFEAFAGQALRFHRAIGSIQFMCCFGRLCQLLVHGNFQKRCLSGADRLIFSDFCLARFEESEIAEKAQMAISPKILERLVWT